SSDVCSSDLQTLPPVICVFTNLNVDRRITDVEVGPYKSVENFTGGTINVALDFRAVAIITIAGRIARNITFDRAITVCIVIPASSTDPRTKMPFISKIDFSQHIKTVCNYVAPVKFSVGFVKIRVVHDTAVLALRTDAQVVTNGVIPA